MAVALFAGCQTGGDDPMRGAPQPTESALFTTERTGFQIAYAQDTTQPEIRYWLRLSLNQPIERPMILRITFQNPRNPNMPLVQQERVEARIPSVTIQSEPIWGLQRGETYEVLIEAFDTTGNRLGTHRQGVFSTIDTSLPNLGRG